MKVFNIFDRLKIHTKLILFLVIPISTILFFSISGTYTKVQELRITESSCNFTTVSFHLADLVHELQKERGLSAGFVGSGGQSFREELLKQRNQTDEKLILYNHKLDVNASEEGYWGLSDKFTYLQQELHRLSDVRNTINTANEGNFFDFYSNINAQSLDIIQYIQVFTNDADLARQGDAYSSLLRLQERAGQERGALNGIFASGKLDSKLFQKISAYVAEQESIFNNYYTVVSDEYQEMLREKMRHPVVGEVEELRAAAISKARRNELLNDLQMMIGYGGLIHHFKDYVIRGEDWYADNFSEISADAKNLIDQYKNLPGMSPEAIANLNSIGTTFNQYQSILKDVTRMKDLGRSIIEIDKITNVDDEPAIDAIKQLRKDVTNQNTSDWWEKATFRIELIKDVSDAIRSDIIVRTQQIITTTNQSVNLFLMLSISNIALSFFMGYLLIRRPVEELANISSSMRSMQENRNFDQQLVVSGNDEISDLANAFNDMIVERNELEAGRLNSENALRESEAKYFDLYDNAPDMFASVDAKTTLIKRCNQTLSRNLGYSKEEIIGRPIFEMYHPDCMEDVKKVFKAFVESGEVHDADLQLMRKNGSKLDVSLNVSAVKDEEGNVLYSRSNWRDITVRKITGDALQFVAQQGWSVTGEKFFSALVKYIGTTFGLDYVIVDRLLDDNKFAETVGFYALGENVPPIKYELHNTPCEMVAGKKLCHFPCDVQKLFPLDPLLVDMKAESYIGIPLWDSLGKPIGLILIVDSKPLPDLDGSIKTVLQIVATRVVAELERIRAEETLHSHEKLLSTIAKNFPNSYLSIIEKDLTIGFTSGQELKKQDLDPESFLGLSIDEVYTDQVEVLKKYYLKTFEGEETSNELFINNQYQHYKTVPLYDEYGNVQRILVVAENITERKKAEEELMKHRDHLGELVTERTSELEAKTKELQSTLKKLNKSHVELMEMQSQLVQSEKMASLGTLTAGIAHEINNPINFIVSSLYVLNDQHKELQAVFKTISKIKANDKDLVGKIRILEKLREETDFVNEIELTSSIIDSIKTGTDRLVKIVNGLTVFTRASREDKRPVNVHDEIELALLLLQGEYKDTIEIVRDYGQDIPVIEGYEGTLNQIFLNLISNAIDAIKDVEKPGKIEIKTRKSKDELSISIKDNGPGIPKNQRSKIFDPFYTTKDIGKGVGLGLSIAYGIIKKHDGKMKVHSEENRYTEFVVNLPLIVCESEYQDS